MNKENDESTTPTTGVVCPCCGKVVYPTYDGTEEE